MTNRVDPGLDRGEAALRILVTHQRQDNRSCICGWSELGRSHPRHQMEKLREAGLLDCSEECP